jgi:hypothetical protein
VDNNDLENVIPGFSFTNGPCNPCGALKQTADYSCPFQLNVKNTPNVSAVWKYLWKEDSPLVSQPSLLSEGKNKNKNVFPLLFESQM